jgi:hypothetical protein
LVGKASTATGGARRLIAAQEATRTDRQCVPGAIEKWLEAWVPDRHPLLSKLSQCRIWEQRRVLRDAEVRLEVGLHLAVGVVIKSHVEGMLLREIALDNDAESNEIPCAVLLESYIVPQRVDAIALCAASKTRRRW